MWYWTRSLLHQICKNILFTWYFWCWGKWPTIRVEGLEAKFTWKTNVFYGDLWVYSANGFVSSIAYRILFTVPVTAASTERSFSKLKLLKNYLRSTMYQERLNRLATLCIEKKLLDKVDSNTIINDFASRNVRRNFWGNM